MLVRDGWERAISIGCAGGIYSCLGVTCAMRSGYYTSLRPDARRSVEVSISDELEPIGSGDSHSLVCRRNI